MIWHAIRVASPLEFRIRDEMHRLGFRALAPQRLAVSVRKKDGKTTHKPWPLLPGYVFVGFSDFPPWASLASIRGWIGPVGFDGTPARLTSADVELIQTFDRVQDVPHARPRVMVGDRVPYRIGRLGELHALVKRLRGGKVVLEVELFGSRREVTVAVESIEAAA